MSQSIVIALLLTIVIICPLGFALPFAFPKWYFKKGDKTRKDIFRYFWQTEVALIALFFISLTRMKPSNPSEAPQSAPSGANQQNKEELKYKILKEDKGDLMENYWVLIQPRYDGEKVAREVKRECKKQCMIQVYDNQTAFDLEMGYEAISSDLSNPDASDRMTAWKERNYVFVADHLVGMIWNNSDEYKEYPQRDWYYEESKEKSQ